MCRASFDKGLRILVAVTFFFSLISSDLQLAYSSTIGDGNQIKTPENNVIPQSCPNGEVQAKSNVDIHQDSELPTGTYGKVTVDAGKTLTVKGSLVADKLEIGANGSVIIAETSSNPGVSTETSSDVYTSVDTMTDTSIATDTDTDAAADTGTRYDTGITSDINTGSSTDTTTCNTDGQPIMPPDPTRDGGAVSPRHADVIGSEVVDFSDEKPLPYEGAGIVLQSYAEDGYTYAGYRTRGYVTDYTYPLIKNSEGAGWVEGVGFETDPNARRYFREKIECRLNKAGDVNNYGYRIDITEIVSYWKETDLKTGKVTWGGDPRTIIETTSFVDDDALVTTFYGKFYASSDQEVVPVYAGFPATDDREFRKIYRIDPGSGKWILTSMTETRNYSQTFYLAPPPATIANDAKTVPTGRAEEIGFEKWEYVINDGIVQEDIDGRPKKYGESSYSSKWTFGGNEPVSVDKILKTKIEKSGGGEVMIREYRFEDNYSSVSKEVRLGEVSGTGETKWTATCACMKEKVTGPNTGWQTWSMEKGDFANQAEALNLRSYWQWEKTTDNHTFIQIENQKTTAGIKTRFLLNDDVTKRYYERTYDADSRNRPVNIGFSLRQDVMGRMVHVGFDENGTVNTAGGHLEYDPLTQGLDNARIEAVYNDLKSQDAVFTLYLTPFTINADKFWAAGGESFRPNDPVIPTPNNWPILKFPEAQPITKIPDPAPDVLVIDHDTIIPAITGGDVTVLPGVSLTTDSIVAKKTLSIGAGAVVTIQETQADTTGTIDQGGVVVIPPIPNNGIPPIQNVVPPPIPKVGLPLDGWAALDPEATPFIDFGIDFSEVMSPDAEHVELELQDCAPLTISDELATKVVRSGDFSTVEDMLQKGETERKQALIALNLIQDTSGVTEEIFNKARTIFNREINKEDQTTLTTLDQKIQNIAAGLSSPLDVDNVVIMLRESTGDNQLAVKLLAEILKLTGLKEGVAARIEELLKDPSAAYDLHDAELLAQLVAANVAIATSSESKSVALFRQYMETTIYKSKKYDIKRNGDIVIKKSAPVYIPSSTGGIWIKDKSGVYKQYQLINVTVPEGSSLTIKNQMTAPPETGVTELNTNVVLATGESRTIFVQSEVIDGISRQARSDIQNELAFASQAQEEAKSIRQTVKTIKDINAAQIIADTENGRAIVITTIGNLALTDHLSADLRRLGIQGSDKVVGTFQQQYGKNTVIFTIQKEVSMKDVAYTSPIPVDMSRKILYDTELNKPVTVTFIFSQVPADNTEDPAAQEAVQAAAKAFLSSGSLTTTFSVDGLAPSQAIAFYLLMGGYKDITEEQLTGSKYGTFKSFSVTKNLDTGEGILTGMRDGPMEGDGIPVDIETVKTDIVVVGTPGTEGTVTVNVTSKDGSGVLGKEMASTTDASGKILNVVIKRADGTIKMVKMAIDNGMTVTIYTIEGSNEVDHVQLEGGTPDDRAIVKYAGNGVYDINVTGTNTTLKRWWYADDRWQCFKSIKTIGLGITNQYSGSTVDAFALGYATYMDTKLVGDFTIRNAVNACVDILLLIATQGIGNAVTRASTAAGKVILASGGIRASIARFIGRLVPKGVLAERVALGTASSMSISGIASTIVNLGVRFTAKLHLLHSYL